MLVKVGGVTNLSDARYCAGMGVEMIGFSVIPGQDNYIDAERFQEIRGWVAGPHVVAEVFGIESAGDLDSIMQEYKPDYLELGLTELSLFTSLPVPFILSTKGAELIPDLPLRPAFIQCQTLHDHDERYPCLLEINKSETLSAVLDDPRVAGISMKGSHEVKPGLKEYNLLAEVLERLDVD